MNKVKVQKRKLKKILLFTFALSLLPFAYSSDASAMLTVRANHDDIKIDFFYHGSTVSIKGEADAGTDLVIKIASPDSSQELKQKGKVGGLLWMSVGKIEFEHAPKLYSVHGTKQLDEILSPAERRKAVLGYDALREHVEISPAANREEKARWFREFVKFKEAQKLYAETSGKITTKGLANGRQEYYILTDWPYQAEPGQYTVSVYAVKKNRIVEQAETNVRVEQTGLVKILASMAKNRAAVYGMLSIGIALGAGFGVGMIFRKGGGSH